MSAPVNACVVLRRDGVCVVLDVLAARLPAIAHWGADVGALTDADVLALVDGGGRPYTDSVVDEPVRLSVLPEHWTGWLGRPGLSGSRAGRAWSPRFTVTSLGVDGDAVAAASGGEARVVTSELWEVDVEALDEVAGLGLRFRFELVEGGLLRSRVTVTNLGVDAYTVDDLVLAYPVPPVARELLDFAGRWSRERAPQRRELTVGTHLREGRRGRTGPDAATLLHAGTPGFSFASGEVWAVHTAWSGNHTHYAERVSTGEQLLGGGELLFPGEVILGEGESYTSPWLYGSHGIGLDAVARRFHRYLRSRPHHPSARRPVTINVWEAVYFDHDLDVLLELAERAASVGVERFVLDDGWFGARRDDRAGLGDWQVSADVWPDGLHPLIDRVKELGMEFGLWFEPEMINLDSDTARAHPEWIMSTGDRLPKPARFQQVINLGIPECYDFIRDAIFAILAEYDIAYIKWDHNRDLVDAGTHPDGRAGVHAQTAAVYRLLEEIKAAHPGLEIESCSSGGARVDLGVLEHTDRVWVSDCIDPHERQSMMRWTAQLLPPELLGSHIASETSHTTGRTHDLDYRILSALFGHLGIEWDLRQASEPDLQQLRAWIGFHKEQRDLLFGGDMVRVDAPDPSLVAHGVVSPGRDRAVYSFASVDRFDVAVLGRLTFPGLDPDRRYTVRPVLQGHTPSGLHAPRWWGLDGADAAGTVLPGSVLATVGLMHAPVNADHAVMFLVTAVD